MPTPGATESSPLLPKQPTKPTEEKMGLKFSVVAGVFQVILVILFASVTRYGDQASPPAKKSSSVKNNSSAITDILNVTEGSDARNDISIYYPSKSMIFS